MSSARGHYVLLDRSSPSYPGSVKNGLYLLYGLMDLSVLSNNLIDWLAVVGLLAAAGVAVWALRSETSRARFTTAPASRSRSSPRSSFSAAPL